MAFVSFSCQIAQARTSNTVLSRSGKSRRLCPVPDLRRKASCFSPLSMMLAVGLSRMTFIVFPLHPPCCEFVSKMDSEFCQMLFSAFIDVTI